MNKLNHLVFIIKEELSFSVSISLGVFLFILFFQPFPLDNFDFNNKLIFVAGISAIVFAFTLIARMLLRRYVKTKQRATNDFLFITYLFGFIIFSLCSAALAFYLRYVGQIQINFYLMFKVVLICVFPLIAFKLNDIIKDLRAQIELLKGEKEDFRDKIEQYEEDLLQQSIELTSENNSEKFSLIVSHIAFIRSADNYVEIIYQEESEFKKKLLRNTLKNIEHQLSKFSDLIRCHRICIVNANFVVKLNKQFNNYWLSLRGLDDKLPVSRQYLLRLKDILK